MNRKHFWKSPTHIILDVTDFIQRSHPWWIKMSAVNFSSNNPAKIPQTNGLQLSSMTWRRHRYLAAINLGTAHILGVGLSEKERQINRLFNVRPDGLQRSSTVNFISITLPKSIPLRLPKFGSHAHLDEVGQAWQTLGVCRPLQETSRRCRDI